MTISLFAYFEAPDAARVSDKDLAQATDVLSKLPRLAKALIYTPPETSADHYFMNDPAPPAFAFQLYFAAIEHLEDVCAATARFSNWHNPTRYRACAAHA